MDELFDIFDIEDEAELETALWGFLGKAQAELDSAYETMEEEAALEEQDG